MHIESTPLSKQAMPTRHLRVWRVAWPMMLSSLAVPLLGLVDTAVMGHLDDSQYLAAVGMGSTLFTTLLWSMAFLKASTTGLAARASGLKNPVQLNTLLLQALCIGVGLSALVLLLRTPISEFAQVLFSPPDGVDRLLAQYTSVRIFGLPAALANLVMIGWFIGQENSRVPLIVALFTNTLNIILNLILVLQFNLNVVGVALGTLVSEWLGLGLSVYFVCRTIKRSAAPIDWQVLTRVHAYSVLFKLNVNFFVRTLFLMSTFIWFTRQGALMGKDIAAVNELLKSFLLVIAFALDGLAHAAEALMGASWAARQRQVFLEFGRIILCWSLIAAVILSGVFWWGGMFFATVMTNIPEVQGLADQYIRYIQLLPLISVWCFLLDGVFIGTTHTRVLRDSMVFASLLVFVPVWYLTQSMGNHGLWIAMLSFFAARGVAQSIAYYWLFIRADWAPD